MQTSPDIIKLGEYAERCYLSYGMSVVKGRALPNVEDGMKPVQRRILYAMREMGLTSGGRHVKSARVVGDVIGKLHPHGDVSVYDAMVRMSQDFTLRYPLVDGQGNWGSLDGDGAAAMRYTECRLTPIAELLLSEMDSGTTDFVPNYDGAFKEPRLLPSRLPILLANGASGIAVGMATEIPPHNLRELAAGALLLLDNSEASTLALLEKIPGPDFPGGAQIISTKADIASAYESGRGSVRVRALWKIEPLDKGQWRVIITHLPHGVSTATVLGEIEAVTNPHPKAGKKDISPEQKALRHALLAMIDTVRDESSDQAPIRIVIEPKSRAIDPEALITMLLANTSLEQNVPINLTVVGRNGNPGQRSFRSLLLDWVEYRIATIDRRIRYRLGEVRRRLHILDGRVKVLLSIDAVVKTIRESDDPKADLMETFDLTEVQAEDILEMRLRQLARLEGIKLDKEILGLSSEAEALDRILNDPEALRAVVGQEISADAAKFGDDRRTLIEEAERVGAVSVAGAVVNEPITLIVSKGGWLRARQGHGIDPASIQYKAGDEPLAVIETRTVWPLILLDTTGRTYTVPVSEIPNGRSDGVPVGSIVEMASGARIMAALAADPSSRWLMSSTAGYGFICALSDMVAQKKAGKAFLTVGAGEVPLAPLPVDGDWVVCATRSGRIAAFPIEQMKTLPGGKGVQTIPVGDDDAMTAIAILKDGSPFTLSLIDPNRIVTQVLLSWKDLLPSQGKRGNRGRPIKTGGYIIGIIAR